MIKNIKGNKVIVKEITPKSMICALGVCPAIFETNNDTFILVGRKIDSGEGIDPVNKKVGEGEIAIEIPKKLLTEFLS